METEKLLIGEAIELLDVLQIRAISGGDVPERDLFDVKMKLWKSLDAIAASQLLAATEDRANSMTAWISVGERLPDKSHENSKEEIYVPCLWWSKCKWINNGVEEDISDWEADILFFDGKDFWIPFQGHKIENVKYWSPLPKSPVRESDNK